MGVVDTYSSINSVALRSATCRRCERASRVPVLYQCPWVRGARYIGACPERPYLRACGCAVRGRCCSSSGTGTSVRGFEKQTITKLARIGVGKSADRVGRSRNEDRAAVGRALNRRLNEDRVGRSRNEDHVGRRQSVEQAAHSQQRWQPLEDGRWGRVVGRVGAGR